MVLAIRHETCTVLFRLYSCVIVYLGIYLPGSCAAFGYVSRFSSRVEMRAREAKQMRYLPT
ncbi:hypothetical protein LX32DRAFT_14926 [Colletotrichum zoysiae]|uniref:Uncharacterized protein n=1 Tax=Colletotrichum zoysiae TaxID=1216348 RepID=A0AAD9LZH6_9PEZI|nr:hypothetical protein LX32DRAFT_14926 [Colletotrichum zoysiae]